jgi:hypothetical protein
MNGHHLILGQLNDFLTGRTLNDTHDERYRQKIARLLVERKGYLKNDIETRKDLLVEAGDKRAIVKIDFLINLSGRICMIIKYGPGSLVTRRRPALAAARLLAPHEIPVAVVTNGEDAEVLEVAGGGILALGLENIPTRVELQHIADRKEFKTIPPQRAAMESRIVYCYEVDDSCPCDEDICKL